MKHLSERQEVLADLMVSKTDMQRTAPEKYQEKIFEEFKEAEEQRAKEAVALVQKKHKPTKCEGDRERARIMQRLEASRAIDPWAGGHAYSSCRSWPSTQTKQCLLPPGWRKR